MGQAADDLIEREEQHSLDSIDMHRICRDRGCEKPDWHYNPVNIGPLYKCFNCEAVYDPV